MRAGVKWFPFKSWKTGAMVLAGILALAPTAQAWTITNINIGVDLNSVAWGKVNNNNNTITGVLNAQAVSNAWFAGQISNALATTTGITSNLVQSSYLVTLTNINPLTFNGSNYIGQFSQFFSFALGTPLLGGGGATPPTNQFEEVVLSYNGTAWFPLTNAGGVVVSAGQPAIFQNVRVAVVGAAGNAGSGRGIQAVCGRPCRDGLAVAGRCGHQRGHALQLPLQWPHGGGRGVRPGVDTH